MPRHNDVKRSNGKVLVTIDGVQHTLTEDAFIALMQRAIDVMQSLVADRKKPNT